LKSSFFRTIFFVYLGSERAGECENKAHFILSKLIFNEEKMLFFSMKWAFFKQKDMNETKTGIKRNEFMKSRFMKVRTFAK
jgi:hypothetical protein